MDKNKKTIIISLILLALAGGAVYYFVMQKDAAKQLAAIREKTEKFINENMLAAGSDGKITEIVEKIKKDNAELLELQKAKHQLRMAAIDKRLQTHQQAFSC